MGYIPKDLIGALEDVISYFEGVPNSTISDSCRTLAHWASKSDRFMILFRGFGPTQPE